MSKLISLLDSYKSLSKNRKSFVTVTLVDIKGSAPQELGAKLIVTADGIYSGTVGGGKLEEFAIKKCNEALAAYSGETHLKKINLQKDIGMSCGGEVTLLFEPTLFENQWKIVIFGAGHVSQALTRVLSNLDCLITVIDSREEWLSRLPRDSKIQVRCTDNLAKEIDQLNKSSFVCLMTMGHETDLPILSKALKKKFPYLGMIGSKAKRNAVESDLNKLGHTQNELKSFICPIGDGFGSNDPQEIAISICAQLLKQRDSTLTS